MKEKEKRVVKGYKIAPSIYNKAMLRAKREEGKLAQLIEKTVSAYAKGILIEFKDPKKPGKEPIGF